MVRILYLAQEILRDRNCEEMIQRSRAGNVEVRMVEALGAVRKTL